MIYCNNVIGNVYKISNKLTNMTDAKIEITKNKATEFSDWYVEVIMRTKLLDYYAVSGCYIMLPLSYEMWETIQQYVDTRMKKLGVKNVYFPLLIPDTYLNKESSHIAGFTPEVVWVSKTGIDETTDDKNSVKLCIRPTSETAIYPTFSKEIKSHSDMPLVWNQWCNVMRWEFTCATPFIRSKEFLWQELHAAFSKEEDMYANIKDMLKLYKKVYEDLLCVPVIVGKKIDSEKFAGGDETFSIETFIPDANKSIQCATAHNLGKNFSKIFDIQFQTESTTAGNIDFAIQTSTGLTTRSIGTAIMTHGDNKGLVLAPDFAPVQIVIVPIFYQKDKELNEKIIKLSKELHKNLSEHYRCKLDDNEKIRPGWKYYNWEAKGVPMRIEIGPKDITNSKLTIHNRFTNEKSQIDVADCSKDFIDEFFNKFKQSIFEKARVAMQITEVDDKNNIVNSQQQKKLILVSLCDSKECDEFIRNTYQMKPICRPINEDTLEVLDVCTHKNCLVCGKVGKACYISKTF